jgi:hypothetical protein
MSLDSVKAAHFHGGADPSRIEPKSYTLDAAILTRPGNTELQIDLNKPNIAQYTLYQDCFRRRPLKLPAGQARLVLLPKARRHSDAISPLRGLPSPPQKLLTTIRFRSTPQHRRFIRSAALPLSCEERGISRSARCAYQLHKIDIPDQITDKLSLF